RMTDRIVGIDPHKRNYTYVVKDGPTTHDHETQVPATHDTLDNLIDAYPDANYLLEACGYHTWMHDHLQEADCTVIVAQPQERDHNEREKSDLADTHRLIKKHRLGDLNTVHTGTPTQREHRSINRKRKLLVEKRDALRNSIEDTLACHGWHAQDHPHPFTDEGRAQACEVLPHLTCLYEAVDALDDQVEALEAHLEDHAREDDYQEHLRSIPGLGPLTAHALSAEIMNPDRFQRADEVVAYFGLDPEWVESAGQRRDQHRISKKGPGYVRGLLVQAAWTHIRESPASTITQAYQAKADEKTPQQAIVMAARKLLRVAWTLMREERGFHPEGPPPSSSCPSPTSTAAAT
ncbi:MAG: IS110 family transposase, partial [Thiohalorhabdaceae bacterium]